MTLPETFDLGRTRELHLADHKALHRQANGAIYAVHYPSITDALAVALANRRPLVLQPGAVYETAVPLNVAGNRPVIHGNGATIRLTQDAACIVRFNGIADAVITDLNVVTAAGVTVQDGIEYTWDGSGRSSTRNRFEGVAVSGRYVNGWRIGEPGTGHQVDKTTYRHCSAAGAWTPGERTLWQCGFLVGDGVVGNVMLHEFEMCDATYNRAHFDVDKARMVTISGNGSIAEVDVIGRMHKNLIIERYRSEGARVLYRADAGGATFGQAVSIRDVEFNPSPNSAASTQPDLRWIDVNYGGVLLIQNAVVRLAAEDRHAVIYGRNLQRPLYVEARGMQVVNTAQADAFDVEGATVDVGGYFQIADAGGIVA